MGLNIIDDGYHAAMYDSTTSWAFGPVFNTSEGIERFLKYAETEGVKDGDVRQLTVADLYDMWERYASQAEDARG